MRDERSPARGLPRETVTIADLAVRLGLTLEDTYEVCRAHGVRAARPTTRISRDDADRLRRARFGHLEREWGISDTALREARTTDVCGKPWVSQPEGGRRFTSQAGRASAGR